MKPSVPINMDKERHLRIDTNALIRIEDVLGKSITELTTSMGVKEMRAIVWAGLCWEAPELTLAEVGDLIDTTESFEYVANKVTEAMNLAFGSKDSAAVATDPNS